MNDHKLFVDFIRGHAGRTDFKPGNIRALEQKLERYVERGGPKADFYKQKLEETRAVLRVLEGENNG